MGRKRTPGLYNREGIWHIDKKIHGRRFCESTGSSSLEEAEKYLAKRCEDQRQIMIYGARPSRSFREAATKFLLARQAKSSFKDDVRTVKQLDAYIGQLPLNALNMNSLESFITTRQKEGVKTRTINYALQLIRHLLNLAALEWVDENGLTWLQSAPKIKLLPETDKRNPYPITWEEQTRLFKELPRHLADMALYAVNTGCREQEICSLRWDWEVEIPELDTTVFVIPGEARKNGCAHVVVVNKVAKSIVDSLRGNHAEFVFTYRGKPVGSMLNSAWKKARKRAGLEQVRVHDLRHTFGRRLRATGVSFEDRQDLLGHKSSRMTTHYSCPEIKNLIEAAEKVCQRSGTTSVFLLRHSRPKGSSRKSPAEEIRVLKRQS